MGGCMCANTLDEQHFKECMRRKWQQMKKGKFLSVFVSFALSIHLSFLLFPSFVRSFIPSFLPWLFHLFIRLFMHECVCRSTISPPPTESKRREYYLGCVPTPPVGATDAVNVDLNAQVTRRHVTSLRARFRRVLMLRWKRRKGFSAQHKGGRFWRWHGRVPQAPRMYPTVRSPRQNGGRCLGHR